MLESGQYSYAAHDFGDLAPCHPVQRCTSTAVNRDAVCSYFRSIDDMSGYRCFIIRAQTIDQVIWEYECRKPPKPIP
jgi:hypothetical protein